MSQLYLLDESKNTSGSPVKRITSVYDGAGDATPWFPLAQLKPLIEVRSVSDMGKRDETLPNGQTRRSVMHYVKDLDAVPLGSTIVVETKQKHEDDDQAGVITTITGNSFVQTMNPSEVADLVRLRLETVAPGEKVFMSISARIESKG